MRLIKKSIIGIVSIVIAFFIVGCSLSETNIVPRYNAKTQITLKNISNTNQSTKVVCVNGVYYFYDKDNSAIYSYQKSGEKSKVVEAEDVVAIAGNKSNIFYVSKGRLYQYNLKNEKLLYNEDVNKFDDTIYLEDCEYIYADEEYVFVDGSSEGIMIFDANSICEKVKMSLDLKNVNSIWTMSALESDEGYLIAGNLHKLKEVNTDSFKILLPKIQGDEIEIAFINRTTKEKIFGNESILGKHNNELVCFRDTLYLYDESGIDRIDNGDISYDNGGGDYAVECLAKTENVAVIVSSSYRSNDLTLESGPLVGHESDNLWYVDLNRKDTRKNYCFNKGEIIWYADLEKYILFKESEIITYDAVTQKELKRCEAEWFDKDSGYQYEIILCHNNWFVFNDNTLIDIVPMEQYLD